MSAISFSLSPSFITPPPSRCGMRRGRFSRLLCFKSNWDAMHGICRHVAVLQSVDDLLAGSQSREINRRKAIEGHRTVQLTKSTLQVLVHNSRVFSDKQGFLWFSHGHTNVFSLFFGARKQRSLKFEE